MVPVSMTQQARLLVGLAIAGAIPLTVGAILWLTGTVMAAAYHGGWSGEAVLGGWLLVTGLVCGLIVFVLAAAGERWTPPGSWVPRRVPRDLMPLASPEQQAFLADPYAFPAGQPPFPAEQPVPGEQPPSFATAPPPPPYPASAEQ